MASPIPPAPLHQMPNAVSERALLRRGSLVRWPRREGILLATALAVATALRLMLAARGWPYSNSDEATLGLMVDDILWHGAHPVFYSGQHYLGALDAYLQAPFFFLLGPTNLALHFTTTVQTLLFLVLLYRFTRMVYSPLVAGGTLVLLAVAPGQALFFMLRGGVHAQDTLLLSALLLWLVLLRLRHPTSSRTKHALNVGIGLVAGLGLWSTFLVAPFVVAAGLALGVEAVRRLSVAPARKRALSSQFLMLLAAVLVGLLPFLWDTLSSGGVGLGEMLRASSGPDPQAPGGLLGDFFALGQQASATLLFGLPSMLGSRTLCPGCPIWPSPQSHPTVAQALPLVLIGAGFSLLVGSCWLIAALPLARDTWHGLQRLRSGAAAPQPSEAATSAVRWGGQMLLVIGGSLTVVEYVGTRSSYTFPDTSSRYLIGVYLCTPLIAAPLCQGAPLLWRWLSARARRLTAPARPQPWAFLATVLLLALLAVNITGAVNAFQETTNQQRFGVPAGSRDLQLLAFLETHHATRFYTTYFVCDRLMFAAQEQVVCSVVSNSDVFTSGFNRIPADAQLVSATQHPAYVFDLTTTEVDPAVPRQLTSLLAAGDPRFVGYTATRVSGYVVCYFVGSSA